MILLFTGLLSGIILVLACQYIIYLVLIKWPRKAHGEKLKPLLPTPSQEILLSFEAISRKKLKENFASSLKTLYEYSQKETCLWLNVILSHLYCFWSKNDRLENWFNKKLSTELWEMKNISMPGLLFEEFRMTSYIIPAFPSFITKVSSCSKEADPTSFVALFEGKIEGPLVLVFEGRFRFVNWPFYVKVSVTKFIAPVYFRYNYKLKCFGFAFLELPKYQLDLVCDVNGKALPLWLLHFIKTFIIPYELKSRLVVPNARIIIPKPSPQPPVSELSSPKEDSADDQDDIVIEDEEMTELATEKKGSTFEHLKERIMNKAEGSRVSSLLQHAGGILRNRLRKNVNRVPNKEEAGVVSDPHEGIVDAYQPPLPDKTIGPEVRDNEVEKSNDAANTDAKTEDTQEVKDFRPKSTSMVEPSSEPLIETEELKRPKSQSLYEIENAQKSTVEEHVDHFNSESEQHEDLDAQDSFIEQLDEFLIKMANGNEQEKEPPLSEAEIQSPPLPPKFQERKKSEESTESVVSDKEPPPLPDRKNLA